MKLAYVCYDYPPGPNGGIGRFTQVLGGALAARGHEVRVIGIYPPDYDAPDEHDDGPVRVWRLRDPGSRGSWVAARWRLYRQLRAWVRAGELDLIEAPDCYGWFAGWPAVGVPLVTRAHGSLTYFAAETGRPVARLAHWLEARSLARTDRWVAVSEHAGQLTQSLFRLSRGPDAVLYNPVPAPEPSNQARKPGLVVYTGTLTPKKGIVALMDAWPMVLRAVPGARLECLGKDLDAPGGGPMSAFLMRRLPPEAQGTVRFTGHVPAPVVTDVLERSAVAVFPSFSESFGLGAAEAMALGCPTVYTSRSCGPEILRDGQDGLLADPADPAALAAAIVTMLEHPDRAIAMGASAARHIAERCAVAAVAEANEAFYAETLARHRRRGGGRS